MKDDDHPRRSWTSENVLRVKKLLDSERGMSIRLIGDELGIPQNPVFDIVVQQTK